MGDEFKKALQKARLELALVEAKQQRLAGRKAQLLQTIAGLAPLVGEAPTDDAVTLADAMRTVMGTAAMARPNTVFTAKIVRDLLQEMGFDLSKFSNPLASIHTAIARMQRAGELISMGDVGQYKWQGRVAKRHPFYGG